MTVHFAPTYKILTVVVMLSVTAHSLVQADDRNSSSRWPSFRGANAAGVADGADLPLRWDAGTGEGDSLEEADSRTGAFLSGRVGRTDLSVTTAVSSDPQSEFAIGGRAGVQGKSADDYSRHVWRVICLDLHSGAILWDKTACEGVPKVKRHLQSSHANATVATDGRHVVAFFASEGLYCYDVKGSLLWNKRPGAD